MDEREARIELRAHHLLCMLTYVGRGYSERFVATMNGVVARIGRGEEFVVVEGPDTLCGAIDPASADAEHCHAQRNRARDAVARSQLERVIGRSIASSMTLSANELQALRKAFAEGSALRDACTECEWRGLCDEVSGAGFEHTYLLRSHRPTAE